MDGLIGLALNRKMKENLNSLFCSELYVYFLEFIGRAENVNCSSFTPDEMCLFPKVRNLFLDIICLV